MKRTVRPKEEQFRFTVKVNQTFLDSGSLPRYQQIYDGLQGVS